MDPVISFLVVVAVVGGVFYFFNKKNSSTDDSGESGIRPAPAPAPVEAKAKPAASTTPKVPSVAELNKKTKAELELLARKNGVELDLRKKKADLVKQARASFQQK